MKKTRIYSYGILLAAFAFAVGLNATTLLKKGHNDIAPATKVNEFIVLDSGSFFDLEDEPYIEDIPFNTCEIVISTSTENTFSADYLLANEEYIDDIPFDTEEIAMSSFLHMDEEEYIDDIPFNTRKVIKQMNRNHFVINQ